MLKAFRNFLDKFPKLIDALVKTQNIYILAEIISYSTSLVEDFIPFIRCLTQRGIIDLNNNILSFIFCHISFGEYCRVPLLAITQYTLSIKVAFFQNMGNSIWDFW
jgi:hypothetical protein